MAEIAGREQALEQIRVLEGKLTQSKQADYDKFVMGNKSASKEQLDVARRHFGIVEPAKKEKEEQRLAGRRATSTNRFMEQFLRSFNELEQFDPAVGELGFTGFLRRKKAQIAEAIDVLPETAALNIQIKPLANKIARDIEGGRVTDQDRKIYADAFANATLEPSRTNIRLMASQLIGLIDDGAGDRVADHLRDLSGSGVDLMDTVINEVLQAHPDLAPKIFGKDFELVEEEDDNIPQ